jgi:hypothetical protein
MRTMAIAVMKEMLGGLDEVKAALDQAIIVLTDPMEECDPALAPHLPEILDRGSAHMTVALPQIPCCVARRLLTE